MGLPKRLGQTFHMKHLAVTVRQHGPKTPEGFWRRIKPHARQVPFKIRLNEGVTPPHTGSITRCGECIRESAPHPQLSHVFAPNLRETKARQVIIRETARE